MKHVVGILLLLSLSACGFTPLYGSGQSHLQNTKLGAIDIITPHTRPGQVLNNQLRELFYSQNQANRHVYTLTLTITEEALQYGFNPDRSTTREGYSLTTNYTLTNKDTGDKLTSGEVIARTAYDVVLSDFSNNQAKQDAQARMIEEAAQALNIKLATYFNNAENAN